MLPRPGISNALWGKGREKMEKEKRSEVASRPSLTLWFSALIAPWLHISIR